MKPFSYNRNDIFIGLMSGTSIDAIDAVAVRFPKNNTIDLIGVHSHDISSELRQQIIELNHPSENELHKTMSLDITLGELFAETVVVLLKKTKLKPKDIRAIGSHGQTIRHQVEIEPRYSLQIGSPHLIAERTGITTVADFRMRDIILGGQGAPLVPAFHKALFASKNVQRVILNIGGMANLTLLGTDGSVIGFDTGPGNVLMDYWFQKHQRGSFDAGGNWARQGKVNSHLLRQFLNEPYFLQAPPKSTGRELFDAHWLEKHLQTIQDSSENIQATLLQLTIDSIEQAIQNWGQESRELFVCGGGAHNTLLMKKLAESLNGFSVNSTKLLGLSPDWVEATAFAWLAKQTIEKKPGNIPSVSGAVKETILGAAYPTS